jgi:hypothetical protein
MNYFEPTQTLFNGIDDELCFFAGVADSTDDTTPPSCEQTAEFPGPPASIEITVQDDESGLDRIDVMVANNADVTVPPFTPGTNDPVVVTAEAVNPSAQSEVTLEIFDVAGNHRVCDYIFNVSEAAPCDVDGNLVIDIADILSIFGSIGETAIPPDPRDWDGDGNITIIDARGCTLECTNPGCVQ